MPVKYSNYQSRTGASIGTIISIPKPSTWTDTTNLAQESLRWSVESNYPGWLECNGQEVSVNDYPDLYYILGNRYGGVPGSTFKLPDYRSKKLMGTGSVDSNVGISPSLTPTKNPGTGNIQASISESGSEGGIYTITTIRQLPPGSEITPTAPSKPDVFFDVNELVLGQPIQLVTGVAFQNYGTGEGEVGGFAEPLIANGGRYIGFGTTGTTPFNSTQNDREIRITNLDLTGYTAVRIYSIAGNDINGGERVNNFGEGLRVVWEDESESVILPAAADFGTFAQYDEAFTAWREIQVDIPIEYRRPGVTIRFRQDLDETSTNNPEGNEQGAGIPVGSAPNAFDMIGIQRIGFLGGDIGGEATDTFTLGTYRTVGFDQLTSEAIPNFAGNVSYSIGTAGSGTGTRLVSGAPTHFHPWVSVRVDPGASLQIAGEAQDILGTLNNRGTLASVDDLPDQGNSLGDAFIIGGDYYVWTIAGDTEQWINAGPLSSGGRFYGRSGGGGIAGATAPTYNTSEGNVISYNRRGSAIRSHSHMLSFGFDSTVQTRGNSNTSGDLVNALIPGGTANLSTTYQPTSDNRGNVITKTLDVVNDLGVSLNPGTLTFTNSSRLPFDSALNIRLQSAEEITLMSPYFRLKYIIKAY